LDRWFSESQFNGPTVVIAGVTVDYGGVAERNRDAVLQRVRSAMMLIERYDERRLRFLARAGTRILLMSPSVGNQYWAAVNAIVLDATLLPTRSRESVAVTLVHEAAHARIESLIHQTRRMAPRVERRCVEEEIAFVRRLPAGDEATVRAWEAAKRATLESPWWTLRTNVRKLVESIARHRRDLRREAGPQRGTRS